jgi:ATP-dependent RNA helicase DeaD
MITFEATGIKPEIIKAITELGFEIPMPIQEKVIPLLLENTRDLVGLAQTGTGKTAAFGLPLLHLINTDDKRTQVLVLCPTRELCMQITKDLTGYSKYLNGLNTLAVYGGASIETQIRSLKKGVQVIVATPGRIIDLINRKKVDISAIQSVVLDEADEMLNMGFQDDINTILAETPKTKRTLLFSATMPKEVANIASKYMNNPIEITIGKKNAGNENVKHVYYMVHASDRYLALKRIADVNPNIYGIIFCRTRAETNEVAEKLINDGYSADALHGELSQAQRDYVMQKFRLRNLQMLVATDVAARGLDVNDLTHVINYNLPDDIEVYTHRSGRTGRAGKTGISIAIVHSRERSKIEQLERIVNAKFERKKVPTGKEICEKQLFTLIDKMENVEVNDSEIEEFLPSVYKKLEWLSREELIKRFVSTEFNRFLEYYQNAPDLDVPEHQQGGEFRERGRDRDRDRGERSHQSSKGFTRFFINIGKNEGIWPKNLLNLINQYTKNRTIEIGRTEILKKFSFFEADSTHADDILKAFQKATFEGRRLVVDLAEETGLDKKDRKFDKRPERKPERRYGDDKKPNYSKRRN